MKQFNKLNAIWLSSIVIALLLLDFLVGSGIIDPFLELTLTTIFIDIMLAVSLNVVIGMAGQFSLGHAGFMAIGAYTGAIMTKQMNDVVGLLSAIVVGALLAGIVALLVGLPTLRLSGDYLAIATLGTAEIIRIIISVWDNVTNGAAGISGVPQLTNWSFVMMTMLLSIVIIVNYLRSSTGRATLAIRDNEIAAESMGVHTIKYKVFAFVLAAVIASVAGTLYASTIGVVTPGDFTFNKSIDVLIIVVFGGIGSVTGSILSAILLGVVNMLLQDIGTLRTIIYALALLIVMIFRPSGLLGRKEFTLTSLMSKKDNNRQKGDNTI